jgi:hypothetical protein
VISGGCLAALAWVGTLTPGAPAATAPGSGLSTSPLAPAWLVLPMAVVTVLVLAGHMHVMHGTPGVPVSRRRIRSVNAGLMLVTIPVLAYAFGIATPARTQAFAVAWSAGALLLGLIVLVALADVVNTWRLHGGERARLRLQMRALRAAAGRRVDGRVAPRGADGRGDGPSSDPSPRPPSDTDRSA